MRPKTSDELFVNIDHVYWASISQIGLSDIIPFFQVAIDDEPNGSMCKNNVESMSSASFFGRPVWSASALSQK